MKYGLPWGGPDFGQVEELQAQRNTKRNRVGGDAPEGTVTDIRTWGLVSILLIAAAGTLQAATTGVQRDPDGGDPANPVQAPAGTYLGTVNFNSGPPPFYEIDLDGSSAVIRIYYKNGAGVDADEEKGPDLCVTHPGPQGSVTVNAAGQVTNVRTL
jgi:hypothetical protein